jgi:hypothetical protein
MNKNLIVLVCLLMAMVWTAGCSCPAVRPVVAAPAPVVAPPPYVPPPEVIKPKPGEPEPSKKLKQRVIKDTND